VNYLRYVSVAGVGAHFGRFGRSTFGHQPPSQLFAADQRDQTSLSWVPRTGDRKSVLRFIHWPRLSRK
jgi:hypothetical protein